MTQPMDILRQFPVRKSKQQKAAFRSEVSTYLQSLGYSVSEESGSFGVRNLVAGDPERASWLVTAHYDTCARLPFPNLITPCNFWLFLGYQLLIVLAMLLIPGVPALPVCLLTRNGEVTYLVWYVCLLVVFVLMLVGPANPSNANDNTSGVVTLLEMARTMPENQRNRVCFVLFDLEEAGLLGSAAYRKAHKSASERQIVLNLDCVGDGDTIMLFPSKKLKKDGRKLAALERISGPVGKKAICVRSCGFSVYPSDQAHFPYGVGVCALRTGKAGIYLGRIHTRRDTILEETNVNILRSALISLITCGAAE